MGLPADAAIWDMARPELATHELHPRVGCGWAGTPYGDGTGDGEIEYPRRAFPAPASMYGDGNPYGDGIGDGCSLFAEITESEMHTIFGRWRRRHGQ